MIYCGIDPSISSTGLVTIETASKAKGSLWVECRTMSFKYKDDCSHLEQMYLSFKEVFKAIDFAAVEGYSFQSKGQGVSKQIELGTMIRFVALEFKKPLYIIAPHNLKKFVGVTQKDEVKLGVYKSWRFENKSGDIIDAYALARYCQALSDKTIMLNTNQKQAVSAWEKNKNGMFL